MVNYDPQRNAGACSALFLPTPSRRAGSELRGQGESPVEVPAAPVPTMLRVPGHPSGVFGIQREACQENEGCEVGLEFGQSEF